MTTSPLISTKANPYVYASDDPVNVVDPSGKLSVIPEYGLRAFGIAIVTGYEIAFTRADLESLQGPGAPGIVKDIILAVIDFEILDLVTHRSLKFQEVFENHSLKHPIFEHLNLQLLLALAKKPGFNLKHYCQVGNERHFIGVFGPKWGRQFVLCPKI